MQRNCTFKFVLLAVLAASILAICYAPADPFSAEVVENSDSIYSIEESILTIHGNIDSGAQQELSKSDLTTINEIRIENNVTTIVDGGLSGCVNVKKVTAPYAAFKDRVPSIFGLQDYPKCVVVFLEDAYKHLIICTDTVGMEYSGDASIKSLTISSDCKTLPAGIINGKTVISGVFKDCIGLESVVIRCPNLEVLPVGAFSGCTSLKDICLSDSLKSIYSACFKGDTLLQNVYTASSE